MKTIDKIFFNSLLGITILFLASCHPKIETIVIEAPTLQSSAIYNAGKVYDYINQYKDTNKEIAASYFNKGIELEKTNLPKAIYNIKRSITLQPTLDKYKKLLSFLIEGDNKDEAGEVYTLLIHKLTSQSPYRESNRYDREYLFEKPDMKFITNYMVYNINNYNTPWGNPGEQGELPDELQIQLSYLCKMALSDTRVKLDTASETYRNIMLQFLTSDKLAEYADDESVFRGFLSTITDTSSNFRIDKNSVQHFDYSDFNGSNYGNEMMYGYPSQTELYANYLQEKKGEYYYPSYNMEHRIKLGDTINAVIYSIDTSATACPKDMRHIYHRLVVYGKNHRIIATDIVANQSGDELATVEFRHNRYTVTHYKRYWEKPYVKGDFDNYLVKTEQLSTSEFEIHPDGTITRVFDSSKQGTSL
jgi:hypothetical protein